MVAGATPKDDALEGAMLAKLFVVLDVSTLRSELNTGVNTGCCALSEACGNNGMLVLCARVDCAETIRIAAASVMKIRADGCAARWDSANRIAG